MPYVPRQYDCAMAFRGKLNLPNIVDEMDAQRLSAYDLYDDFYYNRPETFRVTLRGDSDVEIYLPSTKKIINATARFLAVDFDFTLKGGSTDAVESLLRNIFTREEISRRQIRGKKSMLSRGDMVWYITANDRKPQGKRLNINTIHPGSVFPIEDPEDETHVIGWHIVDLVHDPRDKTGDKEKQVARRQTYRRDSNGQITYEAGTFEVGAWDDRNLQRDEIKPVTVIQKLMTLHSDITAFPVYLIPNHEPDGSSWGVSQVAGIEYIINALNQSITYEDLTLVLQGLGLYATTAAPPIDRATGQPGKYRLHPGNVVELDPGDEFSRVSGVSTVSPFQNHLDLLDRWAMDGSGLPDMATGSVDVSVAQSGIALALKMGPIIAENSDRELAIGGKWEQMGYDLIHGWFPAYEGINSPETYFKTIFGDAMPVNRDTAISEIIYLYTANLITTEEARHKLEAFGYEWDSGIVEKLLEESAKKALAAGGEMFTGELSAKAGEPPPLPNELQPVGGQGSSVRSSVNGEG